MPAEYKPTSRSRKLAIPVDTAVETETETAIRHHASRHPLKDQARTLLAILVDLLLLFPGGEKGLEEH